MSTVTVARYIRDECKKAGFTKEGIAALLAQIQRESRFIVNNVEDGRGWTDEDYTYAVDNGTYDKFCTDEIGYGIYQLTEKSRKTNYWNFTKIRGSSIGNLENQVAFMLWELYKQFPGIWAQLSTSHDLYSLTKLLLEKWENPAEKEENLRIRYQYAQEWLARINELEAEEASASSASQTQTASASHAQTSTQQTGTTNAAAEKVLALARSEIGYHEKASNSALDDPNANSGSGNYTKYARDLDAIPSFYNGKKQGYAYCDVFHDWLYVKCFGAEKAMQMLCQPQNSAGAGCMYSAQYYKSAGRWTHDPQPGDQIFFFDNEGQINHTGIVESVSASQIVTIEGNSSDRVQRRSYDPNSGYIAGYGRPRWDLAGNVSGSAQSSASSTTVNVNVTMYLKLGDTGDNVAVLQNKLIELGYDVGPDGADGDFGNNTLAALKAYQRDNNLGECGYFGPETFKAMKETGSSSESTSTAASSAAVTSSASKPAAQPSATVKNTNFKAGDVVMFKGDKYYVSAISDRTRSCKPGKAKITRIKSGTKHPYYLIRILGGGSNVTGWVNESDIEVI